MCKRLLLLISLFLVVLLANSAWAIRWDGKGDGTSWYDPNNWDPNGIPGTTETVEIQPPPAQGPIITSDVECGILNGPSWEGTTKQVMSILGGNVKINGLWRFCNDDNGKAEVTISGGVVTVNGEWRWCDSSGSYGIANVSGGTVNCTDLRLGDEGRGELNITSGGTVNVAVKCGIDSKASPLSSITVNGGTLTATEFKPVVGKTNLDAGTISCGTFTPGDVFDINEGTLIIDGNKVDAVNGYVIADKITAYDKPHGSPDANVVVTYDAGSNKTIVTATTAYTWARNPVPADGAKNLCPDSVVLKWTPGVDATRHDVYFGTDYASVRDANTSVDPNNVYKDRVEPNEYNPGTLVAGQKYYWRIDETDLVTLWPAKSIWSFTINDGNAFGPNPADGGTGVPLNVTLVWSPGCTALQHDVYFGTDANAVADGTGDTFKGRQGGTSYGPLALNYLVQYYWRIDEYDGSKTYKGKVWRFKAKGQITDPNNAVYYKFDETSGLAVADSSGYERHAAIMGALPAQVRWEPNGGHFGGALRFPASGDTYDVSVPPGALSTISSAITVSVWVKEDVGQTSNAVVFDGGDYGGAGAAYKVTALLASGIGAISWRAGNATSDVLLWSEQSASMWQGDWHHLAFTKDEVADSMKIYFDGLPADANNSVTTSTLANVAGKSSAIGTYFGGGNTYKGRLDDFRIYDVSLSSVKIAGLFRGGDVQTAWGPRPYNGQVDLPPDVNLVWIPGEYATHHDVYLGTSYADVNDANTSSAGIYKGRVDVNTWNPPANFVLNTTWYWRIDEVNIYDPNVWKGKIWKFAVAGFLVVDNFESYTGILDMKAVGWMDGSGTGANPTGSILYLRAKPFYPVHGGNQCAEIYYNNNNPIKLKYSEVSRKYATGQDWTQENARMFTLFFYGKTTNANTTKEQMYVGISDTCNPSHYAEVRLADLNDMKEEEWHEWNIPRTSFGGVTPTDVNAFYIGFGNRFAPVQGLTGGVYFDDLRLYPARCVYGYGPVGNLYKGTVAQPDCRIDYRDVAIMADDWLRSDLNLSVQEPIYANRVGWWKLDEGSGTFVADSSGNNRHGTLQTTTAGGYSWVDGKIGKAVQFSGGRVRVPDTAILRPQTAVTCTAWAYYSQTQPESSRVVVKGPDNKETYSIEINDEDTFVFQVRDVNGNRFNVDTEAIRKNEWMHLAGTYDANTVRSYVNGQLEASSTVGAKLLCQDTNDLAIGNRSDADDKGFTGTVDDVQVYSYGLSAAEVAHIATQGTGNFPLAAASNLYTGDSPQIVNPKDLAMLANNWLKEELWP